MKFQVHALMQPVINGSVHEETPLMNQQQGTQGQPQTHQYTNEPAGQDQFSTEQELDGTSDLPQQQTDEDSQNQIDESQEQTESESFTGTGRETESEQTSAANANSNKPKTFANLFNSSYSSSLPPPNQQPPKTSVSPVSAWNFHLFIYLNCYFFIVNFHEKLGNFHIFFAQPPMTNLRVSDERSIVHPASSGPALSTSNNISPGQQQMHRVRSNQPPQQQQRPPRGGPAPRGTNYSFSSSLTQQGTIFFII